MKPILPIPYIIIALLMGFVSVFILSSARKPERNPESVSGGQTLPAVHTVRNDRFQRPHAPVGSRDWVDRHLTVADEMELANTAMTPELAALLLARAKSEITSTGDRSRISSAIMLALCRQGFQAEAWELLEPDPGSVRENEIGTIFRYDTRPLDVLIRNLEALVTSAERVQAIRSLIASRPAEMANFDFGRLATGPQEGIHLGASIVSAIDAASGDPDIALAWLEKSVDLTKERLIGVAQLSTILSSDATNDPFHQWALLDRLKDEVDAKDLERLGSVVVSNLMKADADRAMNLLTSEATTKHSYPLLREAIFTMYEIDEIHANKWVNTRLPTLDNTGQRIIASLTQVSIRSGEFDTARQWAQDYQHDHSKSDPGSNPYNPISESTCWKLMAAVVD